MTVVTEAEMPRIVGTLVSSTRFCTRASIGSASRTVWTGAGAGGRGDAAAAGSGEAAGSGT